MEQKSMLILIVFFLIPTAIVAAADELRPGVRARIERLKNKSREELKNLYTNHWKDCFLNRGYNDFFMSDNYSLCHDPEIPPLRRRIYKKVDAICSDEELDNSVAINIVKEVEADMAAFAFETASHYIQNEPLCNELSREHGLWRQLATFEGAFVYYERVCSEGEWSDCKKNGDILRDLLVTRCTAALNGQEQINPELQQNLKDLIERCSDKRNYDYELNPLHIRKCKI